LALTRGASAESAAATTLCLSLSHSLLEGGALLWRHRGQALFHPLTPLFRRHVWIEPATASAAIEPATPAAVRWCAARGHAIAATLSLRLGALALTTASLSLALTRRLCGLGRYRRLLGWL
jgi:hypothetical protein